MNDVVLPDGTVWPALGLGTWRLGEHRGERAREVAALRLAFEIGYRLVDTAEMYGDGGAEEVVGSALREAAAAGLPRERFVVVSKFYPHHAEPKAMRAACEASLRRLGVDWLDLYLLHWRGNVPLAATLDGLHALQQQGRVRRWGVSNFDLADMQELQGLPGGGACAANQVYFSLGQRGVEFDLLPWMQRQRIALMAYCPIDQGRLAGSAPLLALARELGLEAAELALAWVLSRPGVIAIPKAVRHAHLRQNWRAASQRLDEATLRALDRLFPPPRRAVPLAMT